MINEMAVKEAERLKEIYEQRWHTSVDISLLPRSVTQDQLCLILRRIIDTGESCLVGYQKVKKKSLDYYDRVDWTIHYHDGDILEEKCPFCGKRVSISFLGTYGQTYVVHCESNFCLNIVSRGL